MSFSEMVAFIVVIHKFLFMIEGQEILKRLVSVIP